MAKKSDAKSATYASPEEVDEAIGRITPADSERLLRFAQLKARGLRGLGIGVDAEDLLQEAVARTVDPDGKRWPKDIKFVAHLIAAMRNIAGHLARRGRGVSVVSLSAPDEQDVHVGF